MRKLLFVAVLLLLPSYAMAQGVTIGGDGPTVPSKLALKNVSSTAPKPEENTKPVIIPNAKRQEWAIISLRLENAKLKAEAAIPAEMKKAVQDANNDLAAFWKGIGIDPADIPAKWTPSDGQNGDIILTPKKIEEKPKTP
jgi:hypothetical protein